MTNRLTVTASAAAEAAGRIAEAVASLPISLHPADGRADLVGIDGSAGWTREAERAIEGGARGILVVDPVVEDVAALRDRAERASVPVVLDAAWTYNPAVAGSGLELAARNDEDTLVEVRVDLPLGADLDRVLLGQLALVRGAIAPVVELRFDRRNEQGYDALGVLDSGATVSLAAILTNAAPASATLRVIRAEDALRLRLPSPDTAAPGEVVVSTEHGATLLPTSWESAHRVAWRTLAGLVLAGGSGTDLAEFQEDAETARRALAGQEAPVR